VLAMIIPPLVEGRVRQVLPGPTASVASRPLPTRKMPRSPLWMATTKDFPSDRRPDLGAGQVFEAAETIPAGLIRKMGHRWSMVGAVTYRIAVRAEGQVVGRPRWPGAFAKRRTEPCGSTA